MVEKNNVWIPDGQLGEHADYKKQVIFDYEGNPLIEALPAIMSKDEFSSAVTYYPPYKSEERFLGSEYRLQCVMRLLKYFQPMGKHIDLEQRISRVLRYGYLARNPLLPEYKARLRELKKILLTELSDQKEAEELKHRINDGDTPTSGFTIIGVSGVGKTTALKKIIQLYPQVVLHSEYEGKPLNFYQIVWIKIDCPHGGSLKDLCVEFFGEVDRLLGTNYKTKYGAKSNPDYLMLAQMCQISTDHCLGMLIIDEIQNLDQAKSGGKEQMLNFLVRLDNKIGVPIIAVGTNKAKSLFQKEFREGRRREGMGSIYWERFKIETDTEKKLWNFFIKELFAHQWTEEKADFDEEFSQVLYDESQGVTDIAVKLYMLSQFRAIVTPKIKKIAPSLMRQVALDSLKLVRPMLDALRSGEPERIARYADIDPIDIEEFYEGYKAKLNIHEQKRLEQLREKMKAQVNHAPELNQIISGLLELDIPPKTAKMFAEKALAARENDDTLAKLTKNAYQLALAMPSVTIAEPPPPSKESKPVKSPKKYATGDLRIIVSEAKLSQVSAYEGLQNNGVIKHPLTEFAIS